jgi:perosamine synthetase
MIASNSIPFFRPSFDEREFSIIYRVLKQGTMDGKYARMFEQDLAVFIGVPDCIAVKSGTLALHLCLLALGIGSDDEVIVSDVVCEGALNAIEQVGANAVLVDVEHDTANMNVECIEKAITNKTKAIIAVHYGGIPCAIDKIAGLASTHRIPLIEDCAQALGAIYNNKKCGTFGDLSIFSFYANKIITTGGEGGAIIGERGLLQKARSQCYSKEFLNEMEDFTSLHTETSRFEYLMDDLAAALGIEQLSKIHYFLKARQKIIHQYNKHFQFSKKIKIPAYSDLVSPSYYQYALNFLDESIDLEWVISELNTKGIKAYLDFVPNHRRFYYKKKYNFIDEDFPIAERLMSKRLCLPCYPALKQQEVNYIVNSLLQIII